MELDWKRLSNKQKTIRSVIFGGLAIAACVIWFDDILQWPRGGGLLFLFCAFAVFPLQALFYGFKWYREHQKQ